MKKTVVLISCLILVFGFSAQVMAKDGKAKGKAKQQCESIQDGNIMNTLGAPVYTGFDQWGYNYQAHMFKGMYCDAYYDATWCQPYKDVKLMMKWNDAWLSNKDCDDDGLLDRHYGFDSYIGSGAWCTNHQSGTYINDDGHECQWVYFIKIVAAPSDANNVGGIWYDADGNEIGPDEWGSFAVIQGIFNDPCGGAKALEYLSPVGPGFGKFKPKGYE